MRWAIKHKSGRTLFVTSDEFIANNRKEMGWVVEEVKMTSREQFEKWLYQQRVRGITFSTIDKFDVDGEVYYKSPDIQGQWDAWQASRAAIEIELPPTTEVHPFGPSAAKMFCELHKNTVAECAKSILAAGLKVKS